MKKILVPCDFSNTAIQAFRFACEMATVSKGEVFLLNVIELPTLHHSLVVPIQAYESAFLKEIKKKAIKNFERIKKLLDGKVNVNFSVEQGSVSEAIKKFVARKRIDLVVMGTHGSSGLREYTIGSNTEKVVRFSDVPVISIKKTTKVSALRNIVFPTNLDLEKKNLIASVKALQSFFKAKLHILHVNTPANFARDITSEKQLEEFAKRNQFKNFTLQVYNDIDEESGIINFSTRFRYKLIAMSTHGRKGLSHILNGSIAEDVVNTIDCPIWTIRL